MKSNAIPPSVIRRLLGAGALATLLTTVTSPASEVIWSGASASDTLWSNTHNWNGTAVPLAGDTAVFNNTATVAASFIDTTGGLSITGIRFDNAGAPAYSISGGGAIQLGNGGLITMTGSGTADQTINAAINEDAGCTLNNDNTTHKLVINGNLTFANLGNVLNKTGAGEVVLTGTNWLNPNVANNANGKLTVMGGGTLTISGGITRATTASTTIGNQSYDGTVYVGKDTAGGSSGHNTLTVSGSGRLWSEGLNLGGGAYFADNRNGYNTVNLSAPGNPTLYSVGKGGDWTDTIGDNTSYNVVNMSNGASYQVNNTGAALAIGRSVNADYNGIHIDGTGGGAPTTFYSGASRYKEVGGYGNHNYMTVTNGGNLIAARLNVGEGGNSNYLSADGSGAYGASLINLGRFCIGGNAGTGQFGGNGNYNYVLIENGGSFIATGGSNIPNGIGMTGTASYNFMQVDGVGSTLYIQNDNAPLTIGGDFRGGSNNDAPGATGNALKVTNGGYAHVNSVYLEGTASRVVLGTGDADTALLEVRSDSISTYAQGIYLDKSDSLLEINNGRLIAGQNVLNPGAMVSGLGQIHLLGHAYVSTSYTGSSIDSVIYGSGGLTKEGSGTLTLSKLNTYTGNTLINGKMVVAATGGLKFVVTDFSNNTIDQSGNGGTLIVNGSFTIDTSKVIASAGTWNLVNRDEFSGLSTTFSPATFSVTRFTKNPDGTTFTWIESPTKVWTFDTSSGNLTLTGGGTPAIDHYEVTASSPQTAGTAFLVTLTAKDGGGNTVTSDSSTVVIMSGTAGVQFDSDGNGTFGDVHKTLTGGTFTISTKDDMTASISITATDGNSKTGTSASIAIQSPFTAWVGPQAPPAGQDHFADDPNHDGVSNGLAWILGGGAMSESRALLPEASTRSGALTLSNFKCLKAGKRLGSTLTLRFGNDLDIWQTAAIPPGNATVNSVAFTITPLDANYDQVSATIPQSAAAEGRLFGRLEASGN